MRLLAFIPLFALTACGTSPPGVPHSGPLSSAPSSNPVLAAQSHSVERPLPPHVLAQLLPQDLVPRPGEEWITDRDDSYAGQYYETWTEYINHRATWSAVELPKPLPRIPTVVRVIVGLDGELQSARVLRSSGSGVCDEIALRSIRETAPFPSPPRTIQSARSVTIVAPVGLLYGRGHAKGDIPLRVVAWYHFERALVDAMRDVLSRDELPITSPKSLELELDVVGGRIASSSLSVGSGDAALDKMALQAASEVAEYVVGPRFGDERRIVRIPLSFQP